MHMILLEWKERHPEREFIPRTDCFGPAAPLIFLGIAIAGAGTAAYGQYQAGKQARYEYKAQAEQEKLAAKDREIARRQKLIRALAGRNVASAASNTALEGSDIALVNRDFKEFSLESLSSEATTKGRVQALNYAGANAKKMGVINSVSTLFQSASSIYSGKPYLGKNPGAG